MTVSVPHSRRPTRDAMLRTTLRRLRPLPRHALRLHEPPSLQRPPRALVAASWMGRHQSCRSYIAMSPPNRPTPAGVVLLMVAFVAAYELKDYVSGRTSPKRLMNESLEIVNANEEVHHHLGSKLVARGDRVGKSSSWGTEVEHIKLQDKDGKPCIRIRYNLFGPRGYASVFAEAAEDSKEGEFNFIYVQFDDTHEVVTVVDPLDAAVAWKPPVDQDSEPTPSLRERLFKGIAKPKAP